MHVLRLFCMIEYRRHGINFMQRRNNKSYISETIKEAVKFAFANASLVNDHIFLELLFTMPVFKIITFMSSTNTKNKQPEHSLNITKCLP